MVMAAEVEILATIKKSGDKPCRKPGHDHKWSDCPDNKYGRNNQGHESNVTERSNGDASRSEREVRFQDDNSYNMMMEYESDEDGFEPMPPLILNGIDSDTEDKDDTDYDKCDKIT